MLKAIETRYKGYRFRSRLEARWAVFFDALGVPWEYEKEGYDLGEAGWYLPVFWVTEDDGNEYWIEIKPHRNLSTREFQVAIELAQHCPGYILFGTPTLPRYKGPTPGDDAPTPMGLLGSGGFLAVEPNGGPMPEWDHYEGSWARSFNKPKNAPQTDVTWVTSALRLYCWHQRRDGSYVLWPMPSFEPVLLSTYGTGNPIKAGVKAIDTPNLRAAYDLARSARFEHGENGR